jgi:opacity protein-like surface antigen
MKRSLLILPLLLAAVPARAQSGLALKGHFLFNETNAREAEQDRRVPAEDGFSIGAEYVLPIGLGVGVTAYREGKASANDLETQRFGVLAEANYFLRVPVLPLRPYVGVHAGLGEYSYDDLGDADPEIEDSRTELGWQAGVRWQINPLLGLDAQYRRVSDSAGDSQSPELERNQVLIGLTLF